MTDIRANEIWTRVLAVLDEKLQYGPLEQARNVVDVKTEGDELILFVATAEAERFFSAEVNQQRLIIQSRPAVSLSKISVVRTESSPIS